MITLLDGELLCSLGNKQQRLSLLKKNSPIMGHLSVCIAGEEQRFPCFRMDQKSLCNHPDLAHHYLEQTVDTLFDRHPLTADQRQATGIFLGSSSLDYELAWNVEQATIVGHSNNTPCRRVGGGACVEHLMQRYHLQGPALTYNTACTSSANALLQAGTMLAARIIDFALVIGVEFVSSMALEGFVVLQLLSPDDIRPFAIDRNGLVLGEAVSAILLSRDDIYSSPWHFLGGASACDTTSVTGTDPSGAGMARVMAAALNNTGTHPQAITAIKAHGTGGELLDLAELRAMTSVFDALPPYCSFKPYIGHTLGACGTTELLLLMECIDQEFMPATLNCRQVMDGFSQGPIQKNMTMSHGTFMLNYCGFGGNNTSFFIRKTT